MQAVEGTVMGYTAPSPSPSPSGKSGPKHLPGWGITLIVLACVALLVLVALLIVRHRRAQKAGKGEEPLLATEDA
jgi:hypothetical protein